MTRTGWIVTVFAPAVLVVVASSAVIRPSAGVSGTPVPQVTTPPESVTVGRAVGQSGCSSVGCHGGVSGESSARWMSSAHEWAAADPHRRAFAVLTEPLADAMMRRLFPGEPEKHRATEDARCLACHTNPSLAAATDPHSVSLRREGVSCEACHGNAGGWLGPHTGFTAATRDAGYSASGMTKLYDLGERALACAGCHVGAPAGNGLPLRDMNHDMIAAGHPRLNFDFGTYQFMLPRHWHERDRATGATDPDFEARAWLVGRVAHAEAACNLTADRAKRADPWPEYAEYSCVACHHRISDPKAVYPAPTGRRLGSLPWQPIWPVTKPNTDSVGPTRDLQAALAQRSPGTVGTAAAEAASELGRLRAVYVRRTDSLSYLAGLLPSANLIRADRWDRDLTEQVYHGAAALARAKIARGGKVDLAAFADTATHLALPRGTVRFDVPPGAVDAVRALTR